MPVHFFVSLAEEGWDEDQLTNLVAYRYLKEISAQDIDTLILGCTHYPLLSPAIRKVMGPNVTLVESGAAVADQMEPELILAPRVSGETQPSLRVKIFGSVRKTVSKHLRQGDARKDMSYAIAHGNYQSRD